MPSPIDSQLPRSQADQAWRDRLELRLILKQVSRSFYLSLVILPQCVRQTVSLAYLLCRAADTIADTNLLPAEDRLPALYRFRRQFVNENMEPEGFRPICTHFTSDQVSEGERQLMRQLPMCFQLYAELPSVDRQLVRKLVLTLTQGMEMDLTHFPYSNPDGPQPLPDAEALDRYTYFVAGIVGEFWTNVHAVYMIALQRLDLERMRHLGIRFGKGLQMTNILKDLGRDLRQGRCYIPQTKLTEYGLSAQSLIQTDVQEHWQPVLDQLVYQTLAHLDEARDYITLLPRSCVRLRLSCMWPLLFAVQTLEVISLAEDLLNPQERVKISRGVVYLTMAQSLVGLISHRYFESYYERLRQRVLSGMRSGPTTSSSI